VAAAVGPLGNGARDLDVAADRRGVLAKSQRGRRDALHTGLGVDHGTTGTSSASATIAVLEPSPS